ncbi:MAG: hypothetical protein LBB34_00195 [Holosporales bacterium]|nr:hypothetical protein [Holosporales bacterium]
MQSNIIDTDLYLLIVIPILSGNIINRTLRSLECLNDSLKKEKIKSGKTNKNAINEIDKTVENTCFRICNVASIL